MTNHNEKHTKHSLTTHGKVINDSTAKVDMPSTRTEKWGQAMTPNAPKTSLISPYDLGCARLVATSSSFIETTLDHLRRSSNARSNITSSSKTKALFSATEE